MKYLNVPGSASMSNEPAQKFSAEMDEMDALHYLRTLTKAKQVEDFVQGETRPLLLNVARAMLNPEPAKENDERNTGNRPQRAKSRRDSGATGSGSKRKA